MCRFVARGLRCDGYGLARGELAVHAGRGYSYALLPSRHLEPVKLRSVKKLSENLGDLLLEDARSVVFNGHSKPVFLLGGRDDHLYLRQYPRFFACIQGVVNSLFDGCQQGLARIVEAKKVAVLCEELRDGYLTLPTCHVFGRGMTRNSFLRWSFFGRFLSRLLSYFRQLRLGLFRYSTLLLYLLRSFGFRLHQLLPGFSHKLSFFVIRWDRARRHSHMSRYERDDTHTYKAGKFRALEKSLQMGISACKWRLL